MIAGECMGTTSSIDTKIPITLIHVKMSNRITFSATVTNRFEWYDLRIWRGINLENETRVKMSPIAFGIGAKQQDGELALLSEGEEIVIKSQEGAEFLILQVQN